MKRASRLAPILVFIAGGCAGGSSCSGVTPLPNGFKKEARIENAASLHITSAGLEFLGQNLPVLGNFLLSDSNAEGLLTFEIPTSAGANVLCPGGPQPNASPPQCITEIDLATATIQVTAESPTLLKMTGTLPVRVQSLPVSLSAGGSTVVTVNGNAACPPAAQTFAQVGGDIGFSIEVDTHEATKGQSRVRLGAVTLDQQSLQNGLNFCGADPGLEAEIAAVIEAQVKAQLEDSVAKQFCVLADDMANPPCPTGTSAVNGICRYGTKTTDDCVPSVVGGQGRLNIGQLVATLSPGTKGGLDFLFAMGGAGKRDDASGFSWGDLNPIGGGATVGFYAGAEAAPVNGCAPLEKLTLPVGIPMPDEVLGEPITGWPDGFAGPHMGIAISERFANYALGSIYNSGLLCIGITSSQLDLLTSGTLGLVASSINDLTLQQEAQQIGLAIRPSSAPRIEFGNGTSLETDPLLRVTMDDAAIDFYIWSLDRFVRFMTVTLDLDVPVNLAVTPKGLQPVIDKIGVNNATVTNDHLIQEDPAKVASALKEVIGGLVGQQLGTALAPIDLNGLLLADLGISLSMPESVDGQGSPALRKLTKGTDDFLGIFAAIEPVMAPVTAAASDTSAAIARKEVDPAGVRLPTMGPDNAPIVEIDVGSSIEGSGQAVEYAYRVDQGVWHPFTKERRIEVRDPWIRLQGRHTVEVRSRVAGEPNSLDPTPAEVEVLIDVEAPSISIGEVENGAVLVSVRDFVSGPAGTQIRARLDQGAWSDWRPAGMSVEVGDAAAIEVEARDEEGNIATASQAIIRGGAIDGASGCGCEVVGAEEPRSWAWIMGLGMAGLAMRQRTRKRSSRG
jgi:hypothetical protein